MSYVFAVSSVAAAASATAAAAVATTLAAAAMLLAAAVSASAAATNATTAAVANTSKFGVRVDSPWRILEIADPSVHAVVVYSYAPDPNDTKARREQLPILNNYSLLPS